MLLECVLGAGEEDGDKVVAVLADLLVVDAGHVGDRDLPGPLDEGVEALLEVRRVRREDGDGVSLCLKLISMNSNNLKLNKILNKNK